MPVRKPQTVPHSPSGPKYARRGGVGGVGAGIARGSRRGQAGAGVSPAPKGQPQSQPRTRVPPGLDYLAPMSPSSVLNMSRTAVRSQVDPLLDEIAKAFSRRAGASQDAITGYTEALAGRLSGLKPQVKGIYDEAQAEQRGVDQALTATLLGSGTNLQQGLREAIATTGGPETALAQAGNLGALTQGLAGQQAGYGASTLSRLIGSGAAAESEATMLPGIAALGGLRSSKLLQGQINREQADALGQVGAQIPGLVQSTYLDLMGREVQKAISNKGFELDEARLGQSAQQLANQQSQFQQGLEFDYAQLGQQGDQFQQTLEANEAERLARAGEDAETRRTSAKRSREELKSSAKARVTEIGRNFGASQGIGPVAVGTASGGVDYDGDGVPEPAGAPLYQRAKVGPLGEALTADPRLAKQGETLTPRGWSEVFNEAYNAVASELRGFDEEGLRINPATIAAIVREGLIAAGIKPPPRANTQGAFGSAGDVGPSNVPASRMPPDRSGTNQHITGSYPTVYDLSTVARIVRRGAGGKGSSNLSKPRKK